MTYMMTMQYNAQLCSSQKFQLNDREDEDWPFIIVNGAILKTIFNMAFIRILDFVGRRLVACF